MCFVSFVQFCDNKKSHANIHTRARATNYAETDTNGHSTMATTNAQSKRKERKRHIYREKLGKKYDRQIEVKQWRERLIEVGIGNKNTERDSGKSKTEKQK